MFKDFLNWAFAVTSDGCKKECVFAFKVELTSAISSGNLTWEEFNSLMNIVNAGLCLSI